MKDSEDDEQAGREQRPPPAWAKALLILLCAGLFLYGVQLLVMMLACARGHCV